MEFQTVRSEPGRLIMTPSQWIERMNESGERNKIVDALEKINQSLNDDCSVIKNS